MRFRYLGVVVGIGLVLALLPGVVLAQPTIPHSIEGKTDCLMCHEAGLVGAPRVPADHAGRGNTTCTLCHRVAAAPAPAPPTPVVTPTPTPRPAATPVAAPKEPPAKPNQVPATGDETPILLVVLSGLLMVGLGWGLRGRWATS